MEVRCKHCRKELFDSERIPLLTAHSEVKENATETGCGPDNAESCSYMSEDKLPEWIERAISQESWTKGRLHCPSCNNRIGSFSFVNELKCACGLFVTPPIRITNSKVDVSFNPR